MTLVFQKISTRRKKISKYVYINFLAFQWIQPFIAQKRDIVFFE